jgi:hypothetical protein
LISSKESAKVMTTLSERVAGRLGAELVMSTNAERFRLATPTLDAGIPFICSSAPRFDRLQLWSF